MTSVATPLDPWIVRDPALLATTLKEHSMPGRRSKTAITKLRRQRHQCAFELAQSQPTLHQRLNRRLVATYSPEIKRRGGEITIETGGRPIELSVSNRRDGLVVLRAEGWRKYSNSFGSRPASLAYLCGFEDGQLWAVRLPGTITTVGEALRWLTPAVVRAALSTGRAVLRQGDVYAIQTTRNHDGTGDLPENHVWDAATRTLSHPQHGDLTIEFPVRFIRQSVYGMGRGAGRGPGGD
jgi:hypothetical protein